MLVVVIAHLCLYGHHTLGHCKNVMVTDQSTFSQCTGAFAMQVLPAWMAENGWTARGYKLARWGCVLGTKRQDV